MTAVIASLKQFAVAKLTNGCENYCDIFNYYDELRLVKYAIVCVCLWRAVLKTYQLLVD